MKLSTVVGGGAVFSWPGPSVGLWHQLYGLSSPMGQCSPKTGVVETGPHPATLPAAPWLHTQLNLQFASAPSWNTKVSKWNSDSEYLPIPFKADVDKTLGDLFFFVCLFLKYLVLPCTAVKFSSAFHLPDHLFRCFQLQLLVPFPLFYLCFNFTGYLSLVLMHLCWVSCAG